MDFEVGPANVRDISYIAGNLREGDRQEVLCQLPEHITPAEIGYVCTRPGTSWIAYLQGKPVMVFGFDANTLSGTCLNAWAFGTDDSRKVIFGITRWVARNLVGNWIKDGVTRVEARSIDWHTDAHRWLKAAGAIEEGPVHALGRNGENFKQFAWHSNRLKQTLRQLRRYTRKQIDVCDKAKDCQAKASTDSAQTR